MSLLNHPPLPAPSRRDFLATAGAAMAATAGCGKATAGTSRPEHVWGERGITPGKLQKPRAMTIDADDQLYLVDITGRIQVFGPDGKFLRGWRTPKSKNGRPTGLSILHGKLYVPDTHYFRVLVYTLEGQLLEENAMGEGGEPGQLSVGPLRPGQLGWTTDIVQDSAGNFYVSEYGQQDRIQKFAPDGTFALQWGGHGSEPGQFVRPQCLSIDRNDRLWVGDAGNHRLQVFDTQGQFLFQWGEEGIEPGRLSYPYSLWIDAEENVLVCEYGNSRVQKLTPEGEPLALWGKQGRAPGQLHNPWAIVQDSQGRTHVLDSYNHRVQRFRM